MPIPAAEVVAASERIRGLVRRTPVVPVDVCGLRLYLKCENLQDGGSFKLRGATNVIRTLSPEALGRGVMAYSSGNHAAGVALAAQRAGAKARVVMPHDAPKVKVDNTASFGAEIVSYNRFTEDREAICQALAAETGAAIVPPFDHPMTIAGQGTAAMELLEEAPELDALIAPLGGGGLMAGTCLIARHMRPSLRLFGGEPALGNDTYLSIQAGERVEIAPPDTIADGLRSFAPGKLTFPVMKENLEAVVLVTEDEIRAAVRWLATKAHLVVEPSGAVPVAAILHGKLPREVRNIGVIVSGGNIEPSQLAEILA
ncbi:MAG: threonine/serine dehydratase [Bryobacterales bacterium]|nr:threonine/serine dehydratase [Bryobacterales bacterium]